MIFNASKGILSYYQRKGKESKDLEIAYEDIDISKTYCMDISLHGIQVIM